MLLIAFRHNDKKLFSRLVVSRRGGDSAHVESAVPIPGTRLSMCVSSSFMDDGVRGKVIDISNESKWRVYGWTGPHVDLYQWLSENYGCKYDTFGMLDIEFPVFRHSEGKKFCVEASGEHIYLKDPHKYDLVAYEQYVKERAGRVVWHGTKIELKE